MRTVHRRLLSFLLLAIVLFLYGCGAASAEPSGSRLTRHDFLAPQADCTAIFKSELTELDCSHSDLGYVMVRYFGTSDQARVQIKTPTGLVYSYFLFGDRFQTFPLTDGSGSYGITVLEHAYDSKFAVVDSFTVDADSTDPFAPFLYPNQYVWYQPQSEAVKLGITLSEQSGSDLEYVEQVYKYVTSNIQYDTPKAQTVKAGYLPDADRTLAERKGICFDYASLMAALLRSQGIPTKLITGYSGTAFHAWISVYLEEKGWVDDIIHFDGVSWSMMDPTLAAANSKDSVKKYIGDGSNYTEKLAY